MERELDARQLKAIELLVEGELNLEEIAEHNDVGISIRTLHRWRYDNEEFRTKWQELTTYYENSTIEEMKIRIREVAKEHLKVVKQDDNLTAKMRAIGEWEDRVWGTATHKVEVDNKDDKTDNRKPILNNIYEKKVDNTKDTE